METAHAARLRSILLRSAAAGFRAVAAKRRVNTRVDPLFFFFSFSSSSFSFRLDAAQGWFMGWCGDLFLSVILERTG